MAGIVVIGASQGGVEALRNLVANLPRDFAAPLVAVVHIGSGPSILPSILNDLHRLPADHAHHGEKLSPSRIYIAPPDHHVIVADGQLELTRGPRENWSRPAIDPLFRTAAEAFGPQAIGIVLTGRLNDGSAGLYEIKRRGGTAIVQEPSEAEAPGMPESAIQNVPVDYRLPVVEMPAVLTGLLHKIAKLERPVQAEVVSAMEDETRITIPSAQTCPECGGAMREEQLGGLTRFHCHIGHAMTAEVLAAAQLDLLEKNLESALRALNERAALCREMAEHHRSRGENEAAKGWQGAADKALQHEKDIQKLANANWEHPETGKHRLA